nr:SpaA isopeptide-forming pilin-related protein [Propionicimonas sp.]
MLLLAVFALGASVVTAPQAVAASPQAGANEAGNDGTDGDGAGATASAKAEPPASAKAEPSASAKAEPSATAKAEPSATARSSATAAATPSASATAKTEASATPSASATSSAPPSGTPTASADGSATPSAEPTTAAPTAAASTPTITSDLTDYPPGGTVTLTGAGWQPGEAVTVVVNDTGELSWSLTEKVVADAEGRFTLTFELPPYYVPDYDVTATGELSGVATTTFTDAASGAWRWWMTDSTPTNNGSVSPGGTITYRLNAQKTTTNNTGFTDAVMTLTLAGNATFTGPTGALGADLGSISGIGTNTLTWTGMNLNRTSGTNNTRIITVTATVPTSAGAGSIIATAGDDNDNNGVFYTGSTNRLETTTHTVTGPIVNSCDFATSGSGAYADSICWFDLTGYNATMAATTSGQTVRQSLPGGYTLTATLRASGTAVRASELPTWSGAFLGNTASGVGGYYGISGMPALYQTGGGTSTLTLSNITLTNSSGGSVTGFALVGADAESSDSNESITWTSDKTLVSIGALGNSCGGSTNANPGSLVWSNGNRTARCNGRQDGATKTGAAILYSQDPATFVQEMVGGGLQGVAFGVMVSGIQLKKAVVNPVASADAFRISVTTSGGSLLGSATANAGSNWAADTGQLYWIASGSNQTFTMAETAVSPTDAANYDATWACTRNGAAYTPTGASSTSKTATLAFGDFIVCTITNTGPALTLTKRVQNAGGGALTPANWTLSATRSGVAPALSEVPTRNSSTSGTVSTASTATVPVPAGVYALGESSTAAGAERYLASSWTCVNAGTGTFTLVGSNLTLAAGNNVTCTITNTYVRTVTVRKTWVNGVSGDSADLVVNGATASPGRATSTSNGNLGSWTDSGNLATATPAAGDLVSVQEVLPSTNRGTYTSRLTCVDGNSAEVTVSGGRFTMPSTSVTCTFTNTAVKPTIALWKTTAGAGGGPFSFDLTNTVHRAGTVTTAAADTRTQVDGDPTTADVQPFTVDAFGTAVTITEGSLPAGWALASASCSNGTGTVGSLTGTTYTIPAADLIAGAVITCDVGNRPLLGTVTWSKVDAGSTATLLKGSEWTLTGPGQPSPGTTVVDCAAAPCTGLDTDPVAGQFSLSLPLGTGYRLVETKAPVGYRLDATEHTFAVVADGGVVSLGAFANQRSTVPALPLTGGNSTDVFVLIGMGLLVAAGLGGWIERRRLLKSP